MIAIVDYGMGNLRSVQKAFEYIGYEANITNDRKTIEEASHIVLPGVGAFCDAVKTLQETGLDYVIKKEIENGKWFLGICLGMQLLVDKSYENGEYKGLGIINGECVKFETKLKVPHMGWNEIILQNEDIPIFKGIKEGFFYFVHSYYVHTQTRYIAAECDYDIRFTASLCKDNVFATQFHPEKSGQSGLQLLKNFGALK